MKPMTRLDLRRALQASLGVGLGGMVPLGLSLFFVRATFGLHVFLVMFFSLCAFAFIASWFQRCIFVLWGSLVITACFTIPLLVYELWTAVRGVSGDRGYVLRPPVASVPLFFLMLAVGCLFFWLGLGSPVDRREVALVRCCRAATRGPG